MGERDPIAEAVAAWAWLTEREYLSVEHHGPVYGDDDEPEEWRVYRERGGINDREWDVVGAGPTALEAVLAARRASLQQQGEER